MLHNEPTKHTLVLVTFGSVICYIHVQVISLRIPFHILNEASHCFGYNSSSNVLAANPNVWWMVASISGLSSLTRTGNSNHPSRNWTSTICSHKVHLVWFGSCVETKRKCYKFYVSPLMLVWCSCCRPVAHFPFLLNLSRYYILRSDAVVLTYRVDGNTISIWPSGRQRELQFISFDISRQSNKVWRLLDSIKLML